MCGVSRCLGQIEKRTKAGEGLSGCLGHSENETPCHKPVERRFVTSETILAVPYDQTKTGGDIMQNRKIDTRKHVKHMFGATKPTKFNSDRTRITKVSVQVFAQQERGSASSSGLVPRCLK